MKKKLFKLLVTVSALGFVATLASCGSASGPNGPSVSGSSGKKTATNPAGSTGTATRPSATVEDESQELYYFDSSNGTCFFSKIGNKFSLSLLGTTYSGTVVATENGYKLKTGSKEYNATKVDSLLVITVDNQAYNFYSMDYFNVKFMSGSTEFTSATVLNGKKLEDVDTPVEENSLFVGWYKDSEFTTPFDMESSVITSDLTLYARFVPAKVGVSEYTVSFYNDNTLVSTKTTVSGVLYDTPTLDNTENFVGWYVSDYNAPSKLSHKYNGETLYEDTNLYAVYSNKLVANIDNDTISWSKGAVGDRYTVTITDPSGETETANTLSTSYSYKFSNKDCGDYVVTISSGTDTVTLYYANKKLPKVSKFAVIEPGILYFNNLDSSYNYTISVECGEDGHDHTDLSIGNKNFFDFSNCKMTQGGIKFVVKAYKDGYLTSVSDTFVYDKTLAAPKNIKVIDDVLTWDYVDNALAYEVTVEKGDVKETYTVTGANVFDLCEFTGDLKCTVSAVTEGYNSTESAPFEYKKDTLAVAKNITLTNSTVTWDEVEGATSYVVLFDNTEYTVSTNSFEIPSKFDTAKQTFDFQVKSVSDDPLKNSQFSKVIEFKYRTLTGLSYNNSTVTWDPVINASKYGLKLNNGTEIVLTSNSYQFEFTKSGLNTIAVCYYDSDDVRSPWTSISVTTYTLYFEPCIDEDLEITNKYYAVGDMVKLPSATSARYDLSGWYNLANGPLANGKEYADGFYMPANPLTLYAYWASKKFNALLDVDGYSSLTEDETTYGVYYNKSYKLPVPKDDEANGKYFAGWYTDHNGVGRQITDKDGNSLENWSNVGDLTLYAYWIEAVSYEEIVDSKSGNIVGYSAVQGAGCASATKIIIPDKYNGYPITKMGNFSNCSSLTYLEFPNTVESVDTISGFTGCSKLVEIKVREVEGTHDILYKSHDGILYYNDLDNSIAGWTVKFVPKAYNKEDCEIMDGTVVISLKAFNSAKMKTITIPASIREVYESAFYYCSNLVKVTFLSDDEQTNTLKIAAKAFYSCSKLEEVVLPAHLADLSLETIYKTDAKTDSYSTPFYSCNSLSKISASGDLANFKIINNYICSKDGDEILYAPKFLSGNVTIPEGVIKIGDSAFRDCKNITSITIPDYVAVIGAYAFKSCTGLTSLTFEENEDANLVIKEQAFHSCSSLASLVIPAQARTIEKFAFGSTSKLTTVEIHSSGNSVNFADQVMSTATSSTSLGTTYVTTLIIGANVPEFNIVGSFSGSSNKLANIKIDSQNTSFYTDEKGVIYNASKTKLLMAPNLSGEFVVPDTVEYISPGSFSYRKNISKIVIGKNVTEIGENAFYYCSGITEFIFEDGGTADLVIGNGALRNCSKITSIVLPNRTKTIDTYAFGSCSSLANIVLPEGLTEIGDSCFVYCSKLITLNIPSTLVKLGTYSLGDTSSQVKAFDYLNNLEKVNVSENNPVFVSDNGILYAKNNNVATSLCFVPKAFAGDLILPKTINKIGKGAFKNNSKITSISFADNMSACVLDGDKIVYKGDLLEVGEEAFYSCSRLKSVNLPNLASIPASLFYMCQKLESFEVPNTVTSIASKAFYYCTKLSSLTFEAGNDDSPLAIETVTGYNSSSFYHTALVNVNFPKRLTDLGAYTFYEVSTLKSVTLPSTLKTIGDDTFYKCTALENVEIGEDSQLEKIGKYAFHYCPITSIYLPETLETIDNGSFQYSNLKTIKIPSKVKTLGTYAFYRSTSLETVEFAENSELTKIGDSAFYYCTSLSSINLPEKLEEVGSSAFNNCSSLKEISFDNCKNIKKINSNAFSYTGIESFKFPEYYSKGSVSVFPNNNIGTNLFRNCKNLKTVTLSASITSVKQLFTDAVNIENIIVEEGNKNFSVDEENGIIYNLNKDTIKYVFGAKVSKDFKISNTVKTIDPYAFYNQSTIKNLTIPNSVSKISEYAFDGAVLESVVFEDGSTLKEICKYAFYNCNQLSSINLPSSVTTIGNSSFQNCTSLTEINISNVSKLDDYAFSGCKKLKDITYSDTNLTSIGNYAFRSCESIESFTIPAKLTKLGTYVFDGCKSLSSVTFAEGFKLTKLDNYLFNNCVSLTSIEIPSSVTTLGNSVFAKTGITKFIAPEKLKTLGTYDFDGCVSLKTVDLSNSAITSLSNYSFRNCTELTSVLLPNALTYVGSFAFNSCEKLTSIDLPDKVVTIGNNAFAKSGLIEIELPTSLAKLGGTSATANVAASNSSYTFDQCLDLKKVVFKGKNLTIIPKYVFNKTASLEEVILTDSITTIGSYAFSESGIKSIDLLNATTLNTYSFQKCASLETVKLNSSTSEIPNYCFSGCSSLSNINIPAGLTSIGNSAFTGASFTSFDLSNVTSIGTYAFQNNASLSKVKLADNLIELPNYLFQNCQSLKEIKLPSNLTSIGDYTFSNTGITSIKFGQYLSTIGERAFNDCTSLKTIDLSENKVLASLGELCFDNCSSLTNFAIPTSVTTLGNFVFQDCIGLTGTMKISSSVTSIAKNPFAGCLNIDGVEVDSDNPEYRNSEIGALYSADDELIYYPEKATGEVTISADITVRANAFERCDGITKIILSEGIEGIPASAFSYMYSLEEVILPSTLKVINSKAFEYDTKLLSLTLPEGLETLATYAFSQCGIESLTIPSSIESIPYSCFSKCPNLKTVNLGTITEIGSYAFEYCSALEEIVIPNTVTNLGSYIFRESGIKKVTIPASIVTFGSNNFKKCTQLAEVTLEEGVTTLPSYTFDGCTALTSITLPSSLTTIENYCFRETGLIDVVIPNNISSLGTNLFASCENLNTITLPNTLEAVPSYLCYNSGIKSIVIPASVKTLGSYAFSGCTSLSSVTIEGKLTSISTSVFADCTSIKRLEIDADELTTMSSPFANWTSEQTVVFNQTRATIEAISTAYQNNTEANFVYSDTI